MKESRCKAEKIMSTILRYLNDANIKMKSHPVKIAHLALVA